MRNFDMAIQSLKREVRNRPDGRMRAFYADECHRYAEDDSDRAALRLVLRGFFA